MKRSCTTTTTLSPFGVSETDRGERTERCVGSAADLRQRCERCVDAIENWKTTVPPLFWAGARVRDNALSVRPAPRRNQTTIPALGSSRAIREGSGHLDTAKDLVALGALFDSNWDVSTSSSETPATAGTQQAGSGAPTVTSGTPNQKAS